MLSPSSYGGACLWAMIKKKAGIGKRRIPASHNAFRVPVSGTGFEAGGPADA